MAILLILLALFLPRVTILLLWVFTNWFEGVFATIFWPFLGFIFLPLTMLWFSAVQNFFGGQWTAIPIIGLVIAVLLDMSPIHLRRSRRETVA